MLRKLLLVTLSFLNILFISCNEDDPTPIQVDLGQNLLIDKGTSVIFWPTIEGDVTDYFWEFEGGDPATSIASNPQVFYNQEGVFDVKLTVSNSETTTVLLEREHITVGPERLDASFTIDKTEGKIGDQFQFTNASTGEPTSIKWTFTGGNPATSSDENPLVTYDSVGVFRVLLEIDSESDNSTDNQLVTINPLNCQLTAISFNDEADAYAISYNANGQVREIVDDGRMVAEYDEEVLKRVTEFDADGLYERHVSYAFNANGLLTKLEAFSGNDQATSILVDSYEFEYNTAGNLTEIRASEDEGNSNQIRVYQTDENGNLGAAIINNETITYEYNTNIINPISQDPTFIYNIFSPLSPEFWYGTSQLTSVSSDSESIDITPEANASGYATSWLFVDPEGNEQINFRYNCE